jgi:hypothetical protein
MPKPPLNKSGKLTYLAIAAGLVVAVCARALAPNWQAFLSGIAIGVLLTVAAMLFGPSFRRQPTL